MNSSSLLPTDFQGTHQLLASSWYHFLPLSPFQSKPINYLEIGVGYGANVCSVSATYASHPNSTLHCIDPFMAYPDYPDLTQAEHDTIHSAFIQNLQSAEILTKTVLYRDHSIDVLPKLPPTLGFELIYVDGNHHPIYRLEDLVLCFRRLATHGVMIVNDNMVETVNPAVESFLHSYKESMNVMGMENGQLFLRKL